MCGIALNRQHKIENQWYIERANGMSQTSYISKLLYLSFFHIVFFSVRNASLFIFFFFHTRKYRIYDLNDIQKCKKKQWNAFIYNRVPGFLFPFCCWNTFFSCLFCFLHFCNPARSLPSSCCIRILSFHMFAYFHYTAYKFSALICVCLWVSCFINDILCTQIFSITCNFIRTHIIFMIWVNTEIYK